MEKIYRVISKNDGKNIGHELRLFGENEILKIKRLEIKLIAENLK